MTATLDHAPAAHDAAGDLDTVPVITEPGVYDLTDEQYHGDPVLGGSLSSSGARTLATSTPARFAWERAYGRADTSSFDFGRAAHTHVLGTGAPIAEIGANDWRSPKTRAKADAARAAGMTPLLTKDAQRVYEMADRLREHPVAGPLLARDGVAEQSFVAADPETGVMCRARVDWLPDVGRGRVIVVDYKSTVDASPEGFAKASAKHGYHQQGPWYGDVLTWLGLHNGQPPLFVLIAQEKTAPYLVTVNRLSPRAIEWGRVLNRKARDTYLTCTLTGQWPGYAQDPRRPGERPQIVELDLPGWQVHQYESAMDAGAFDIVHTGATQ